MPIAGGDCVDTAQALDLPWLRHNATRYAVADLPIAIATPAPHCAVCQRTRVILTGGDCIDLDIDQIPGDLNRRRDLAIGRWIGGELPLIVLAPAPDLAEIRQRAVETSATVERYNVKRKFV